MTKLDIMALGSGTDCNRAGVTLETVGGLVFNFLITPFPAGRLALTDAGGATLQGAAAGPIR